MKHIPGEPEWHLSDRQRHESYEGALRLVPELPLVGWMHLLDALPHAHVAHAHPGFYEIHCIVRGSLSFWVGEETYTVLPGMAIFTRPGELHGGVDGVLSPAEWYWIQIDFRHRNAMPGLSPVDTQYVQQALDVAPQRLFACSEALRSCFERLIIEHRTRPPLAPLMARLVFQQLLVCLARDLTPSHAEAALHSVSPAVRRALHWIEDNLTEPVTIRRVATAAGLSPSSLRQHFFEELGFSPADYVTRQRIERAKLLLHDPGRSITQIAITLGFNTSSHFSAVFKRLTGLTPSDFRNQTADHSKSL